ncbi:MAG: exopolysaccharide biosynthesis protein, partial [Deltaproteobacteria bacterium]|nr:exopolysaccharide biosynthesis protein [Deltaproteobacteria bacterium]
MSAEPAPGADPEAAPGAPHDDDARRARELVTVAVTSPRRLRLDELLRELGARDADHDGKDDRPDGITIGELVDKAAEAGFGFLIGILTLIAIPFFGLSTPFGLAIAVLGAQLM